MRADGLFRFRRNRGSVDEQLPFPVGVTGVDDGVDVGTCNGPSMMWNCSLLAGLMRSFHSVRNDGQILAFQRCVYIWIVVLRLGCRTWPQTGDDTAAGTDSRFPADELRQALGQFPAILGFRQ